MCCRLTLFQYICHDIRVGLFKEWRKYLFIVFLFSLICFQFLMIYRGYNSEDFSLGELTFGDYIFFCFKGMPEFNAKQYNNLNLSWICIQLSLAYLVSFYPSKDINGYGQLMIIKSKKKIVWWISKFIWCVLTVLMFYVVAFITVFIFSILFGNISFFPQGNILTNFCDIYYVIDSNIIYLFFILLLNSITISLLQMVISILIKPIIGLLFIIIMHIFTIFTYSEFVYGNQLMLIRSSEFITKRLNYFVISFVSSIILIAFSFIIGYLFFRRKDIIN